MDTMEKRHSSPSPRAISPRPRTHRNRSNSFPIIDVLGCSTPEAELILAEGRAAVRSRQASVQRHRRRKRSFDDENEEARNFRPQDHMRYLEEESVVSDDIDEQLALFPAAGSSLHTRVPSNATDASTSTVVGHSQSHDGITQAQHARPGSPLGNYSANLAKFIQSQLNSIPSYQPTRSSISPRSCPDLTFQPRSPPQSPMKSNKRTADMLGVIELPPLRPPLRSAFSAWSSADEDTDNDNDVPPLPDTDFRNNLASSKASNSTPSVLGYYEQANDSSFLFTSTPLDEEDQPDTAKGVSFPEQSALPGAEPSPTHHDDDYPSSALSTRPQLTSSSAPSISSASTASYFDCKRPLSLVPELRDRIIAAVAPQQGNGKILTAVSPFEGAALANVHDILVESQQRVHVDGMSFDMIRDFTMPDEGMRRVTTPC